MKDKVDFGKRGVLTWDEALLDSEICLASLLEFAETPEEEVICLKAGWNGDDIPPKEMWNEYLTYEE